MLKIKKILIDEKKTITDAMKQLNQTGTRCLFVIDKKKKFKGTVTDGDLRRYILKMKNFDLGIDGAYNENSFYVFKNKIINNKKLVSFLKKNKNLFVPVLNDYKEPIEYLEYSETEENYNFKNLVLVMAGGKGVRMRPLTYILPKPLMPVNKKPMILNIFDRFKKFKFNNFLVSVRADEKILNSYLNQFEKKYKISYLKEKKPLGSGGCLKKVKKQNEPYFVINCDTLIQINPLKLLNFHKERNSILTIVACLKSHKISYGQCDADKNGFLKSIKEKPSDKILTNVGMYVVDPKIIKFLPKQDSFNMDILINNLLSNKKKISIFPIQENDWKDTGNLKDYFDIINKNKIKN
tara:strand:+ start:496 stop:1548 length:1053 start_codon:yes stop_codon:yes gene_type:complete